MARRNRQTSPPRFCRSGILLSAAVSWFRATLIANHVSQKPFLCPARRACVFGGLFPGRPFSLFRMHWDHEPIRFGPRVVPARNGRAKTRAWVIFQGCWGGPHAATGDRSYVFSVAAGILPVRAPTRRG